MGLKPVSVLTGPADPVARLTPPPFTMTRSSAVLFDLDGVLIDSEPVHFAAESEVLARYGLELPRSLWESFKGTTAVDYFRQLRAAGIDAPVSDVTLMAETDAALIRLLPQLAQPFAGAVGLVESLRGRPLGLVTSSGPAFTAAALEILGLTDVFAVIVTGDQVSRGKPAPEPYLLAALRLGVRPEDCIVVEDSLHGVSSALAAGMTCVAVAHSFAPSQLDAAHHVLDGIASLAGLLNA